MTTPNGLLIPLAYFFGLHIIGIIFLVGWIQHADSKYTDYLTECGQNKIWWYVHVPLYSLQAKLTQLDTGQSTQLKQ